MSSAGRWMAWADAWSRALYGSSGFYAAANPGDHFRTSVHASPLFARALVVLAREQGVDTVLDLGAGQGELVNQMHSLAPDLHLVAVELRPRPPALATGVEWTDTVPAEVDGLVVANELLDNIPCDVVQLDASGTIRLVEVQMATGRERLGAEVDDVVAHWVERWWPLTEAGQRAEVGLARETLWAAVCRRVRNGGCLAMDFGHVRDTRPPQGSLTSYRHGRLEPLCLDARHDIAASVAVDALAHRVGGTLATQRDALHRLGIDRRRPPVALAASEPSAYIRALAASSQAAELTAPDGLGAFYWLLTKAGSAGVSD